MIRFVRLRWLAVVWRSLGIGEKPENVNYYGKNFKARLYDIDNSNDDEQKNEETR
jgi:hypothetical protein